MNVTSSQNGSSGGRLSRLRKFAENAGVSAAISLIVSAAANGFLESRLENSKNRAAIVMHQKDQFDSSQNNLLTELGLYTGRVFDSSDPKKREKLDAAIVTAQLQVHSLAAELNEQDVADLTAYEKQLETMRKQLEAVNGPKDLAPVFISAQEVLKLHDKIGERVNQSLGVSIF